MSFDIWFPDDVRRILHALADARRPLTTDEAELLRLVAKGFGMTLDFSEYLKPRGRDY